MTLDKGQFEQKLKNFKKKHLKDLMLAIGAPYNDQLKPEELCTELHKFRTQYKNTHRVELEDALKKWDKRAKRFDDPTQTLSRKVQTDEDGWATVKTYVSVEETHTAREPSSKKKKRSKLPTCGLSSQNDSGVSEDPLELKFSDDDEEIERKKKARLMRHKISRTQVVVISDDEDQQTEAQNKLRNLSFKTTVGTTVKNEPILEPDCQPTQATCTKGKEPKVPDNKKGKNSVDMFASASFRGIFGSSRTLSGYAEPKPQSKPAEQEGPSVSEMVKRENSDANGTSVQSTTHTKGPRVLCPWVHGNAKPPVTTQKDKDKIIEDEEWTKMNVGTLRKVLSVFGCHPNNDNKPDLVKTAKNHKHGQGLMRNARAHEKGFKEGGQSVDKTKKLYCLHSYLRTYNHEEKTFEFESESEPDEAIVNTVENQTDKKTESVSPVTTIPSMVTAVPASHTLAFLRKNLAMSLPQSRIQKDGGPTPAKEMPMSQQISDDEGYMSEEVNDEKPTSPQDGGLTPTEEKPMSQECNDTEQEIDGSTETGESQEATSESTKLDSLAEFRSLEYWQKSDYRGGGQPTLWSRSLESQERHEDQKNERARKRQKGLPSRSPSPQFEQSSQLLD